MAINKKNEKEPVIAQAQSQENTASSVIDAVWDGWMNGVKMMCAYQREMENLTLQTLERQKEIWTKTTENMDKMEEEMKKFLEDIKVNYQNNVKNIGGEQISKTFEEWTQRLDEIAGRIQQLTWTPGKANLNVVNKSQEQLEASLKNVIAQQQRTREEVQSLMDDFLQQVKATQKGVVDSFEANKNNTISLFK
ncbi:Polyhydroxyalkanoic acid inclusion protein [compost metagenome]